MAKYPENYGQLKLGINNVLSKKQYDTSIWVEYYEDEGCIMIEYDDGIHNNSEGFYFSRQDILKILKLIPTKEIE